MARQPDTAPKGAGVKALSSRLLQMKFMKRGQAAKTTPQAAPSSAAAAKVTPHRVSASNLKTTGKMGCIG